MKKVLFTIALTAGLMAASCSQEDQMESLVNSTKSEIAFSVTTDQGSRSSSAYENGTDVSTITVSAWARTYANDLPGYGSPNNDNASYFLNDVLTRQAGSGVFNYTTGARYWPQNGETLDFFAVVDSPVEFSFTGTAGHPGMSGIKQQAINEMPDMLFAYTPNETLKCIDKENKPTKPQQNVSFHFDHAFAKVIITAEVKNENLRVCITDVAIRGIRTEGDFTFNHKTGEGLDIKDEPASWSIKDEYMSLDTLMKAYNDDENPIVLDVRETAKQTLVGERGEKDYKFGNLLVLPGNYNGRNSSKQQTYIELKGYAYNISDKTTGYDEDTDFLIYPKPNEDGSVTPATMIVPIEFDWAMGTVNRYNIVFDCGNGGSTTTNPNDPAFVRIGYEVEVNDWATGENVDPSEYKK